MGDPDLLVDAERDGLVGDVGETAVLGQAQPRARVAGRVESDPDEPADQVPQQRVAGQELPEGGPGPAALGDDAGAA